MAKKTTTPSTTEQHAHEESHDHHDHTHGQPMHPLMTAGRMIDFSIPWAKVQEVIDVIIVKYQPHVKTDGFRKGKVPAKIVRDMVGAQRLFEEAAEKVVPQAYVEAVKAADAKPISDPEIHVVEMKDGQEWKFHAHIAEYPEFELGDYKKAIKKGLKDLEEELKKESKDAKKDDAPADSEKAAAKRKDQQIDRILSTLQQTINPKIPELLVRQEVNRQLQQMERQLQMMNIEVAKYLKSVGKTIEDLQQEYAMQALATWQLEFILDTIAKEEKIEADDKEVAEIVSKSKEELTTKQKEDQTSQVKYSLRKQKVLEYLQNL